MGGFRGALGILLLRGLAYSCRPPRSRGKKKRARKLATVVSSPRAAAPGSRCPENSEMDGAHPRC